MILARALGPDIRADLELGFSRMGLPRNAREYLMEKLPPVSVLLTGLGQDEGRFLKSLAPRSEGPGYEEFPSYVAGDIRHRPGTALLSGRRSQLERVWAEALRVPQLKGLADALGRLLETPSVPPPLVLGKTLFTFGRRTYVMGVVNVTPDSFSDGGRFFDPETAAAHGLALVKAGADALDIGGESTRPGAPPVSVDEELRRVLPVIERLRAQTDVPLSIDTTKAQVAKAALALGASWVNDISGFRFDEALPKVVADAGAACCLMHIQGTPETMQQAPRYADVVAEVMDALALGMERAEHAGIPRARVVVDPGIGFGKTLGHNLMLLRRLGDLRSLGGPVLVGTSRKSFLGKLTHDKPAEQRLFSTLGSVAAVAARGGADFVRVHDVAEVQDALAVADALRCAEDGGDAYAPIAGRS